jgi:hypothetical protein
VRAKTLTDSQPSHLTPNAPSPKSTYPEYYRALAVLGQVHAAHGDLNGAVDYNRRAIGIISLPGYSAALDDVYSKVGCAQDALRQKQLIDVACLNQLNCILCNRVLVDFYAPDSADSGF